MQVAACSSSAGCYAAAGAAERRWKRPGFQRGRRPQLTTAACSSPKESSPICLQVPRTTCIGCRRSGEAAGSKEGVQRWVEHREGSGRSPGGTARPHQTAALERKAHHPGDPPHSSDSAGWCDTVARLMHLQTAISSSPPRVQSGSQPLRRRVAAACNRGGGGDGRVRAAPTS